jgi:hypothetical protein
LREGNHPATPEEVQAAALQFVRKISGFNQPSRRNAPAFERAVAEVADSAARLIGSITSRSSPGGAAVADPL